MKSRLAVAVASVAVLVLGASPAAMADGGHAAGRPGGTTYTHLLTWAPGVHLPRTHLPHLPRESAANSTNWAGYAVVADKGAHLRYTQTYFTVPSVDCSKSTIGTAGYAYASHWIGLDGYSDNTVEQTGVSGFCTSTSGSPSYYAWYEMYPLSPVAFNGISPGDAMRASVYFNGTGYQLALKDLTTDASVSTTQTCPTGSTCDNASAEVISEDPGGAVANGYDLAEFGMANYVDSAVTSKSGVRGTLGAGSLWSSTTITMVDDSSAVMAAPTPLEGNQAFGVTWESSS